MVAGMRLARRLLASAPLAPYYAYEDFPGPGVQTDDELVAAATQRAQTTFHPGCTCRMGPASDPLAVVDDQLRVHGLEALRVVDASIMPKDDFRKSQRVDDDDRRQGVRPDQRKERAGRRACSG